MLLILHNLMYYWVHLTSFLVPLLQIWLRFGECFSALYFDCMILTYSKRNWMGFQLMLIYRLFSFLLFLHFVSLTFHFISTSTLSGVMIIILSVSHGNQKFITWMLLVLDMYHKYMSFTQ